MLLKFLLNIFIFFITSDDCFAHQSELETVYGDEGSNLTLPCKSSRVSYNGAVMWRHQGRDDGRAERTSIRADNSLVLQDVSREDYGIYTCIQDNDVHRVINAVKVYIRTAPPALVNVSVVPSTILALLHWEVADDGGYPITHFTAQYRLKHTQPHQLPDPWHIVLPGKINPSMTHIDIYQLEPNASYVFQIWANNRLGRGEIVELEAVTMNNTQEIELGKHLLAGAENFDTRIWVAAVAVVMGTLVILATATIYALYKECHLPPCNTGSKDTETMELIPNIILNPGYHDYLQSEWIEPDENSNNTTTVRLNNNTVINPLRV